MLGPHPAATRLGSLGGAAGLVVSLVSQKVSSNQSPLSWSSRLVRHFSPPSASACLGGSSQTSSGSSTIRPSTGHRPPEPVDTLRPAYLRRLLRRPPGVHPPCQSCAGGSVSQLPVSSSSKTSMPLPSTLVNGLKRVRLVNSLWTVSSSTPAGRLRSFPAR